MELSAILPHVEALIFASEKPLTSLELTELINNALGFLDDKITLDQIEAAVLGVIEKYDADFYPFEIRESGGGWQFLTKRDYHKTVAQLNGDKFLKRLSAASLETLAIIAYKQPITKGEIESIRGVNSDYSIQKLLEKELIIITGRNEDLPGKPLVYATSKTFMDYFGINSPDELPMIKDVLSSQILEPTPVPPHANDGLFSDSPVDEVVEGDLVVRANGELIEEPQDVIEKSAEVVEPEQVIGEDAPDDVIADANGDEGFAEDNSDEDVSEGEERTELEDAQDTEDEDIEKTESEETEDDDFEEVESDETEDEDIEETESEESEDEDLEETETEETEDEDFEETETEDEDIEETEIEDEDLEEIESDDTDSENNIETDPEEIDQEETRETDPTNAEEKDAENPEHDDNAARRSEED